MKFIINQSDLSQALSLVSRAVPSRPTHPILGNVLVQAKAGTLVLTGFDLNLGIKTSLESMVVKEGTTTIPAKLFTDIVSKLVGDITVSLTEEETHVIVIESEVGTFTIQGLEPSEYPEFPSVSPEQEIELPVEALKEGLRGVNFAASTDETKQILTGVCFTIANKALEFAATDGHRLAVVTTEQEVEADDVQITLPAFVLKEVEKVVSSYKESNTVKLRLGESQAEFEIGTHLIICRKLEGEYPRYKQLLPTTFAQTAVLDRKALVANVERVGVLAEEKINIVQMGFDSESEQVEVTLDAREKGKATASMPMQFTGETITIGFNHKYLMDGLKAMNSTEVQMQSNTPGQPVIITPLGMQRLTYLVMPVQLRH